MKKIGFEDKFLFKVDNYGKFECHDEIGRLWGLEKILEICNRECGNVFDLNFFEFGSAEFSVFTKIPMSGKVSHFMMFGTSLNYSCFDSEVREGDFDLVFEIVNLHKKMMSGDFLENDDLIFKKLLDEYSRLCRLKDLPVPFVYEALAEEIPSLGIYYNLDLDLLKERVLKSSCKNYNEILEKIKGKDSAVVFSLNVLNAPTLSFDFPFWKIDSVIQIHGVNEVELLAKMGLSNFFKDKTDRRGLKELGISVKEFILRFKEMFGIEKEVFYEDGFFYWK